MIEKLLIISDHATSILNSSNNTVVMAMFITHHVLIIMN